MTGQGRSAVRLIVATIFAVLAATSVGPALADTLKDVRARGYLNCGVNEGLPGFSDMDQRGIWTGFDVDFCRAVAAAIFGDASKAHLVPLSAEARFQALQSGKIDVLARNSTWTMSRETEYGLTFVGVTYYDGQGFLVPRASRVNSALQLNGAKVCVQRGTTTIDNLADYFSANRMNFGAVVSMSTDESIKNYDAGLCSALTSDLSQLYALRLRLTKSTRSCCPAGRHFQGAAGSRCPQQRSAVDRHRAMGAFRDAQCRGAWRQHQDNWAGDGVAEAGGHAARRQCRRLRAGAWTIERMGGQYRAARRQLRRGVRAKPWRANAARHTARSQSIVDGWRHPVRSADTVRSSLQSITA